MKKTRIILFLFAFYFLLTLETAGSEIFYQVNFDVSELKFNEKSGFVEVKLETGELLSIVGYPQVPLKILNFSFPNLAEVESLAVTGADGVLLEGDYRVYPAQFDEKTEETCNLASFIPPNPLIYEKDDYYPGKLAEVLNSGYVGKTKILTVALYPVQYNPVKRKFFFYTSMNLKIFCKNGVSFPEFSIYPNLKSEKISSGILNALVKNNTTVTNFSSSSPLELASGNTSGPEYLIITDSSLKEAFYPLAEWKTKKGVSSAIVTIDSIYQNYSGRDFPEKIRNFLIEAYTKGAVWVLLGGDEDIVPVRYAYHANTTVSPDLEYLQICDLYYSDLTGNWDKDNDGIWGESVEDSANIYPELYVGRAPVKTPEEASTFVKKVLNYEKNPGNGDFSYLTKALWGCSDQMRDWEDGLGQHTLVAQYVDSSFYQNLNSLAEFPSGGSEYPQSPTGPAFVDMMSQGWGIIGIFAHGRSDGFVANSNLLNQWPKSYILTANGGDIAHGYLPNLSNSEKLGIIYSVSCDQEAIDNEKIPNFSLDPCIAEEFLKLPQGGAVAFLGYSRWGWVSSSYKLAQKFMEGIFSLPLGYHLGVAEAYSKISNPLYLDLIYGHNLFGDPEMPVWTKKPESLIVTHPTAIKLGQENVKLEALFNGEKVGDVRVSFWMNGELLYVGYTNANGFLNANIITQDLGYLHLVGTKHNFIPFEDSILVSLSADVEDEKSIIPNQFSLLQNYPNPFNPTTKINFTLPEDAFVHLNIYNLLGQKVQEIVNGNLAKGFHEIIWDGSEFPSGIYFYQLKAKDFSQTKKMILLK